MVNDYAAGFDVVYHDAGEREIRAVVAYLNDSALYTDAKHTVKLSYEDALDLCVKGYLRIFATDTFYAVTSFKDTAGTSLEIGYGASQTVTVTKAA